MAGLLSGDERQAEAAAPCLPSLGAEALIRLTGLTSSTDPEARWWATRALSGFADPAAVMPVVSRLSDPDPAVRQCAVIGLRLQRSTESLPALARTLFDDDALVA